MFPAPPKDGADCTLNRRGNPLKMNLITIQLGSVLYLSHLVFTDFINLLQKRQSIETLLGEHSWRSSQCDAEAARNQ